MERRKALGVIFGLLVVVWALFAWAGTDEPTISNAPAVWPQYYNGTNFKHPRVDASTRATTTVDYFHHEIHDGSAFFVSGVTVLGSGVTNAIAFAVPANANNPHLTTSISSTNVLYFYLMEDSQPRSLKTNLASGATPFNHDRNSTVTSGCTVGWIQQWSGLGNGYVTPGGHSMSGTTLFAYSIGSSGIGQTGIGGQYERENELILRSGTTYLLLFSSGAAGNNVGYNLNWYEHTAQDD